MARLDLRRAAEAVERGAGPAGAERGRLGVGEVGVTVGRDGAIRRLRTGRTAVAVVAGRGVRPIGAGHRGDGPGGVVAHAGGEVRLSAGNDHRRQRVVGRTIGRAGDGHPGFVRARREDARRVIRVARHPEWRRPRAEVSPILPLPPVVDVIVQHGARLVETAVQAVRPVVAVRLQLGGPGGVGNGHGGDAVVDVARRIDAAEVLEDVRPGRRGEIAVLEELRLNDVAPGVERLRGLGLHRVGFVGLRVVSTVPT